MCRWWRRHGRNPFTELIRELRTRYSFTDLKGIRWDEIESRYTGRADAAVDADDFARVIAEMLSELADLHVWIEMPDGRRRETHRSRFEPNYDPTVMRSNLSGINSFEGIGFVARCGEVAVAVVSGLPVEADYDGFVDAMRGMRDVDGYIIDVRRNPGGSEPRAAQIAGLFAARRTKYARTMRPDSGGILHETSARFLDPVGSQPIGGRVVCLIGPGCVSSGEGLALMMKSLDQVTMIGQPTRGASGNPQPVALSNGVRVWFSRWVSMELDGTPIEERGVEPDERIEHVPGRDVTFDRALEIIRSSK